MKPVASNKYAPISILIFSILIVFNSCNNNPEFKNFEYSIVTSDIDNFWEAYDLLANSTDSADSIQTIQTHFLDRASPEFKKYLEARPNYTAKAYYYRINRHPKFWRTIRPLTLESKNVRAKVDEIFNHFKERYPEFSSPDICFGITPISSGGTTDNNLILIGTEISAVNPKFVEINEIEGFYHDIFENSDGDLFKLITHEAVHTQQNLSNLDESNLLELAIIEGGADFLAEQILNKPSLSKVITQYGDQNEQALKDEFFKDYQNKTKVNGTDWFYKYDSNRPADLGYYIGYKICKSYYDNSKDKEQAFSEILEVTDFESFLKKSKYNL